ncbi:helix-turn-helix transcriptional regulator [uncultured Desulfovibrio sp.]|uniref:helix-turn-helix domain-containing protein n=1 Tax=uncultured Desulfovibrio sp. TaxID=167968 RepID=UPI0025D36BDC|nr:helix-turn-helix transcriptional regulator [uncultured Desulfovibrio sp.]
MSKNSPPCPFGDMLVSLRKERGISQYALARTSGISERYLSYLEHGVFEPRARTLIRLADALAIAPGELFALYAARLREQGLEEPEQTRSPRPR